jgi:glycosyltransferase involved in cell wall biosynthesis
LHKTMSAILGNSQSVVRQLYQLEQVPANRLGLIYNGIEAEKFENRTSRTDTRKALGLDSAALTLITLGNLIPYKGHLDLIDALSIAAPTMPQDWRLFIVGRDDGIGASLRATVAERGLAENIRFLGQRSDVANLLIACDIGLLCSHQEGFSNAILESMAAGLAMIVTDVGGNSEAVIDEECGIVVPAHDPAGLAQAILRIAANETLRKKFGVVGRARVVEEFSLGPCVDKYDRLYRGLLAGGPPADIVGRGVIDASFLAI